MEQIISEFIKYWRERHAHLHLQSSKIVHKPFYLGYPIQIEAFRLYNSELNQAVQFWIFSQIPDLPDCEIMFHEINTLDVQNAVPELLKSERYNRELPVGTDFHFHNEPITHRLAIAEACESAIRVLDRKLHYLLWGIHKPNALRSYNYPSDILWTVTFEGDPTLEELKADVDSTISQMSHVYPSNKGENISGQIRTEHHFKLVGSYIYPPVWIGSRPVPEVKNLVDAAIWGNDYWSNYFNNVVCKNEANNTLIAITQDGLVVMGGEDKDLFIKYFNILVALLNISGGNYLTVRESDLAYSDNPPKMLGNFYGFSQWVMNERMTPWKNRSIFTPVIPNQIMEDLLESVVKIVNDKQQSDLMLLYAEASSHFMAEEYTQSVLWSWILVEKIAPLYWARYISENKLPEKLVEAFEGEDISKNIKMLYRVGILNEQPYQQINKLRKIRNEIIHNGKTATESQASELLDVCKSILSVFIK
jgi:hypothetical protein